MVRVDSTGRSNSLIQVRGLDKTYKRGGEEIHVLQGLNLDVDKGDFVAFMGPSGSGKTTLLNLMGGLDVPSRGSITVAGDEVTSMSASKLTQWRARHVGFIFQMYNLIPVITAFQNVELPLLLTKLSKSELRKHVATQIGPIARPRQILLARRSSPRPAAGRSCDACCATWQRIVPSATCQRCWTRPWSTPSRIGWALHQTTR